ncbi:MAG: RHS repeat domain-containing protein [Acidobacteriaceae bacterium]
MNDEVLGQQGEQVTELGMDENGMMAWQHTNVYANGAQIAAYDADGLHFLLSDWEGTRRAQTDYAGVLEQTCQSLPFGSGLACTVSSQAPTEQLFAGISLDPESALYHALHREYDSYTGRWTAPDPYNGSYDLLDPQSMNRYSYVQNHPLVFTDPSGLSIGSDICAILPTFFMNSSDLLSLANLTKFSGYSRQLEKGSCASTLEAFGIFAAKQLVAWGLERSFTDNSALTGIQQYKMVEKYFAVIQAGVAIGCSIDYNSTVCGPPQLAWLIPGGGGDVGLAVGDLFAVGAAACAVGNIVDPVCDAIALYELANSIYGFLYDLFGWGPPQFKGSLLPRPGDLGGLGTSPIGIPNQNLKLKDIAGQF